MKSPRSVRLVVVGSSNTDLVLRCPRLPHPGETIAGGEFERHAGGKGANQAVAAARAGAQVVFVGRHGDDEFGRAAKAALRREGIDVRHFRTHPQSPSGVALILVGGCSRENLIAVASSANDRLSPADILTAERAIARADAVIAQLEIPLATVEAAARLARAHGVPFILNPAPAQRLPVRLLRAVDTLTPNAHEARLLTGRSNPRHAARELLRLGVHRVVITLGARGALIADAGGICAIPAYHAVPADTVGAGDCFTAWLATGLAEKLPLREAAMRASRAAALAVTRAGAQSGMPLRREVVLRPARGGG